LTTDLFRDGQRFEVDDNGTITFSVQSAAHRNVGHDLPWDLEFGVGDSPAQAIGDLHAVGAPNPQLNFMAFASEC
jgi:ferredoxin